jgi:hypothetical protein
MRPEGGESFIYFVLSRYASLAKQCRVFLITIPICVIAAGGILMFLKLEPPEASFVKATKELD